MMKHTFEPIPYPFTFWGGVRYLLSPDLKQWARHLRRPHRQFRADRNVLLLVFALCLVSLGDFHKTSLVVNIWTLTVDALGIIVVLSITKGHQKIRAYHLDLLKMNRRQLAEFRMIRDETGRSQRILPFRHNGVWGIRVWEV